MKVSKDTAFKPVTIVLETQVEVEQLRHVLDNATGTVRGSMIPRYSVECSAMIYKLRREM
jgi:hypothetical protein